MTGDSVRVQRARADYDAAVRDEQQARRAAADALAAQSARRRRLGAIGAAALLAVAVVLSIVALLATSSSSKLADADADAAAAVTAATAAISTMLNPDPADPDGYLRRVVENATGTQRERLEAGGRALREYVASLIVRPVGVVVAAGSEHAEAERASVLLVAQTSDPVLVGARDEHERVSLRVQMELVDGRWLVGETEQL